VTISLGSPLVVNAGDVIGLGFEFDIRKSLAVDMNGQLTGVVNPAINVKAITPSDADAFIDELIGLVLKDPISGQPVFVARSVTELPN